MQKFQKEFAKINCLTMQYYQNDFKKFDNNYDSQHTSSTYTTYEIENDEVLAHFIT